jgi:hypothetical protein
MSKKELSAGVAGDVSLGGEISVHRVGFGAMRLTGEGIWGPPKISKGRWRFFAGPWSLMSISLIPRIPTVHT